MNTYKERYHRQLILEGFGEKAQEKLSKARVLVIGAGGLGCPILQYLAVSGVGTIGIADDDIVSLSNLNRQVLFGQEDIGKLKAEVAKKRILALNDTINVVSYTERWNQRLCVDHFPGYDIIVDATDNFATKYLINDACVLLQKPLVFGAVSKFEGQVAILNIQDQEPSINYRDIFPVPPKDDEVLSCSEAGVLGVIPGVVGVVQAMEVIKLITGIGKALINQISIYKALTQEWITLELSKDDLSGNYLPPTIREFFDTDYEWLCKPEVVQEITVEEWWNQVSNCLLVDVREENEFPKFSGLDHLTIPLSSLPGRLDEIKLDRKIIFVCQSGVRSKKAAALLNQKSAEVYSLHGGVQELVKRNLINP